MIDKLHCCSRQGEVKSKFWGLGSCGSWLTHQKPAFRCQHKTESPLLLPHVVRDCRCWWWQAGYLLQRATAQLTVTVYEESHRQELMPQGCSESWVYLVKIETLKYSSQTFGIYSLNVPLPSLLLHVFLSISPQQGPEAAEPLSPYQCNTWWHPDTMYFVLISKQLTSKNNFYSICHKHMD